MRVIPFEKIYKPAAKDNNTKPPVPENAELNETLRRKQKEYEEQLIAINDLMNYSADVAYGIQPKE